MQKKEVRMEAGSVARFCGPTSVSSTSVRRPFVPRSRTTFLDWSGPARSVGLTSWMARHWCVLVHSACVMLPFFPGFLR